MPNNITTPTPKEVEFIARALTTAFGYDPDGKGGDPILGIYDNWQCRVDHAHAILAALIAAPDDVRTELVRLLNPWQPIETAPKDGVYLLGYSNDGGHVGIKGSIGAETYYAYPPTKWLPLPAPPEDKT